MGAATGGAETGEAATGKKKTAEIHPHPVLDQLNGVQYCVNSPPPWLESVILGFQHYLLSLCTIVLIPSMTVPQMGGDHEDRARVTQNLLFISGLNTLLQTFFGTRLPSVISGSYAFLVPITSVIQAKRYKMLLDDHERFAQTMRGIQGTLIVSSCFQMIIGFLGFWRNTVGFMKPLSIVPLVTFTGLGLYYLGFPVVANCVEVGLPELILVVIISQYLPSYVKTKRPICDRFAVLLSIPVVWIYAEILSACGVYNKSPDAFSSCPTDHAGMIASAPWIYIPYPFQWGSPTFDAGEVFAMILASLVASTESTGAFLATARYGSATPVPPSVVSRGIGWLGIGTFLNGVFGSVTGATASVENAGLLALTKVGSRRVVQISAVFMILFSLLGKVGAIFASIPLSSLAALYCIFFGYVAAAGLGHLQFCNLNSFRTKFILGFSFTTGLSIPQYFREYQLRHGHSPVHTHSTWFNDGVSVMLMSHATVAVIVGLLLDRTLPREDNDGKDSGSQWWERFVLYNGDARSNEFYRLPCNLNSFFPPL